MPEKSLFIGLSINCDKWLTLKTQEEWEDFFSKLLLSVPIQMEGEEISILLTDDIEMNTLNRTFREKDKATNVLAFPSIDFISLGDIVLSYETIKLEAQDQGKDLMHHVTHLFIHGYLHLLGYDHEKSEEERIKMETLEIEILKKLKIENPYVE